MKYITYILLVFIFFTCLFGCKIKKENERTIDICNSSVNFNISSVESIILHPEVILQDIDEFWATDTAYIAAKEWHEGSGVDIPFKDWEYVINYHAEIDVEKRTKDPTFIMAKELQEKESLFNSKAIEHICSFLPASTLGFNRSVYFTAYTLSWAFASGDVAVVNINSTHFEDEQGKILNTMIHEIYHVGYRSNVLYQTDIPMESSGHEEIIHTLLNEGLASYVSYAADSLFPYKIPTVDYVKLEDEKEIRRLHKELNRFFISSENMLESEMDSISWELGIMQRAYYVVGSFMAKTIDEKLGREALVSLIRKGPSSFINTYNSIAPDDLKIVTFKVSEDLPIELKMKQALLKNDMKDFNYLKKELINADLDSLMEQKLDDVANIFIDAEKHTEAIEILRLNSVLFPSSWNVYQSLGKEYVISGNKKEAIKNFQKSVELNPKNDNGINELKKLYK